MLKTPQTSAAGHWGTDLKLARKLLPCWLAFTVLGGAIQAAGEEKTSVVLPSDGSWMLH